MLFSVAATQLAPSISLFSTSCPWLVQVESGSKVIVSSQLRVKITRISPRTLQRRLRDEGTSFADLLDDLRQEMALRLLRDRKLAIYEVAFLLGYAEPSTFHRAFRRGHCLLQNP